MQSSNVFLYITFGLRIAGVRTFMVMFMSMRLTHPPSLPVPVGSLISEIEEALSSRSDGPYGSPSGVSNRSSSIPDEAHPMQQAPRRPANSAPAAGTKQAARVPSGIPTYSEDGFENDDGGSSRAEGGGDHEGGSSSSSSGQSGASADLEAQRRQLMSTLESKRRELTRRTKRGKVCREGQRMREENEG